MCTTWAVRSLARTSRGHATCSASTPVRRTRRWWVSVGGTCGSSASSTTLHGSCTGSSTRIAMHSGNTARCARTIRQSSVRCTRSAAGQTPTATPYPVSWQGSPAPARRSSGRGLTAGPSTPGRVRRSVSSSTRCAGGIIGSKVATPESWTSRRFGCGCSKAFRRPRAMRTVRAAGWRRRPGLLRASRHGVLR